ncbi:MAG: hypothetical protein BMS9Abin07_0025 [Acidimicrobiia bacterium]|nr:MAG: hypothetical protein BMS9Abin07_0025 [Acidimicrobiia bacterium]
MLVVDQLTKAWAVNALDDGPIVFIDGFLRFRLAFNTGAAFSTFTRSGPLLGLLVIGVVIFILFALRDTAHRAEAIGLGLVLGGAIGNLADRLLRGDGFIDGAVVDFIDWWFIPTFNIADSAVFIGVVVLLISSLFRR